MDERRVEVFLAVEATDLLAGELWFHRRRNRESATFSYAVDYLEHPAAFELDPALPLRDGLQQTPGDRRIFAAFGDCGEGDRAQPDRDRLPAGSKRRHAPGGAALPRSRERRLLRP